jgi:hypothetical protein
MGRVALETGDAPEKRQFLDQSAPNQNTFSATCRILSASSMYPLGTAQSSWRASVAVGAPDLSYSLESFFPSCFLLHLLYPLSRSLSFVNLCRSLKGFFVIVHCPLIGLTLNILLIDPCLIVHEGFDYTVSVILEDSQQREFISRWNICCRRQLINLHLGRSEVQCLIR